jgi:HK97 family phage major capsid protein
MNEETQASSHDIKKTIDDIHTAVKKFNDINKELTEKIKNGDVNIGLIKTSLDTANDHIDKLEEKLENMQKAELKARRMNQVGEAQDDIAPEKKQAWNEYIRKGEQSLSYEQVKLLQDTSHIKGYNTVADGQGGYLVLPELDREITRVVNETSPIRQYATVKTISTDQYEKPQITDGASCNWTDDRDSPPGETKTNTFKKLTIMVNGLEALVPITLRSLEDSIINVEQLLSEMTAEAFMLKENRAFVSGNGVGKPQGFLSYPAGSAWRQIEQIPSLSAEGISYEGLIDLTNSLKADYEARAVLMMNRKTIADIRKLLDRNKRPLYEPAFASNPAQIFGFPIVKAADMPLAKPGELAIAFADFKKAYTIIDRKGITLLRDPYTNKGNVLFWTHKRVGGGVDNFEAIKLMKIAAA